MNIREINGMDRDGQVRGILLDRMLDAAAWATLLGLDPVELMQETVAKLDKDAIVVINRMPEEVEG